jgi:tetratricopeptide (TPR) repeat protein
MRNASHPVTARVERRNIPTYPALAPDRNPMFFVNRNIQGSKGNIYPHPFTDQLSSQKVEREYQAVVLENEYLELVLLPELGGRIFTGLDKTNGYDFFYRHNVIKPALIGLFGPWISGGVEFNWPQHHRPSTFDPTDYDIEEHPDGSKTVWMGEHDPLNRTKGMVGICLYPGKAYLETKVRLYNRTPYAQTFLWWANAGVHINDHYQVIFPPDVHHAVFHVKNPVISFPIAKGEFNSGLDYGDGTDISYWVNSPEATSFFAGESKYEFFGGYDHEKNAGVVHVADAGISPGKKYFTWANGRFGHQWNRNLMDDTGEYLELMAGVYTDNQPDFTWIMPYETKTFSQFWYPVQSIGGMKNANLNAAVNLEFSGDRVQVGVYGIETFPKARIVLSAGDRPLLDQQVDLGPGKPFTSQVPTLHDLSEQAYLLCVTAVDGQELVRYQPDEAWDGTLPEPYKAIPGPEKLDSVEELYLAGLHLEQYRHPTLQPECYWAEALRRDPGDSRVNVAMGRLSLRQAALDKAEVYFQTAVDRLVSRNFNPPDGEAHYYLGLAQQLQGKLDKAYKAFQKASWTYTWLSAACYGMAQIDCLRGNMFKALEHLDDSLKVNQANLKALNLKSAILRNVGHGLEAERIAQTTVSLDPLDYWARFELVMTARTFEAEDQAKARTKSLQELVHGNNQTYLDIAFEYTAAGFYQDALTLLALAPQGKDLYPMVAYTLGWLLDKVGHSQQASEWYQRGKKAKTDYCFPWRLEEITVLNAALIHNRTDPHAAYYLANLLYDKNQHTEAVRLWKTSVAQEPSFSIPWRNLGQAAYNLDGDLDEALRLYANAFAAGPDDPRLLLEYDYLLQKKCVAPEERLALFERNRGLVEKRDDLLIRYLALLNRLGKPEEVLKITSSHLFHAWEGGEGSVTGQYATAHWLLGKAALDMGDAKKALDEFELGKVYPANLGEDPGEYPAVPLIYWCGLAHRALGQADQAKAVFEDVLRFNGEVDMIGLYRGKALIQLGREEEGRALLRHIARGALEQAGKAYQENYFYSGHPSPLFAEDRPKQVVHYLTSLAGMALAVLGDRAGAKSLLLQVYAADPANLQIHEELKTL